MTRETHLATTESPANGLSRESARLCGSSTLLCLPIGGDVDLREGRVSGRPLLSPPVSTGWPVGSRGRGERQMHLGDIQVTISRWASGG